MSENINKCVKTIADINLRKMPPTNFHKSNVNHAVCWKQNLKKIEKLSKQKSKKKHYYSDLYAILPKDLYEKVVDIISMGPRVDDSEDIDNIEKIEAKRVEKAKKSVLLIPDAEFSSTSVAKLNELKLKRKEIDFHLCPPRAKDIPIDDHQRDNWMSEYIKKDRSERIIWESVLFKKTRAAATKEKFEDYIMNKGVKDINEFMTTIAPYTKTVTEENIKDMFLPQTTNTPLDSFQINPKEVFNVPVMAASILQTPDATLNEHLRKYYEKNKIKRRIKKNVAFGRTLPKRFRSHIYEEDERNVYPVFPEELRTTEYLFKDITHLASVHMLVDLFLENEKLKRPEYLKKVLFTPQATTKQHTAVTIPLYQLFRGHVQ